MNLSRVSPTLMASAIAVAIAAGGLATDVAKADGEDNVEQPQTTPSLANIPDPPDCVIPADPLHQPPGMACWKEWQAYIRYLQDNPDIGAFCDAVFDSELVCWLIDDRDIDVTMDFPAGVGSIEVYQDGELYDVVSSDCVGDECIVSLNPGFWGMSLTSYLVLPYGTTFVIRPEVDEKYYFFDLHQIPSLKEVPSTGFNIIPILSHPSSKELNTDEQLSMSFKRFSWP